MRIDVGVLMKKWKEEMNEPGHEVVPSAHHHLIELPLEGFTTQVQALMFVTPP